MENYLTIGDTHGNNNIYFKILNKYKNLKSIHVGDYGFKKHHQWHIDNIDSEKHKVNFGNHDDYTFLNSKHSCGDYSYNEGLMTVRGAFSIDYYMRTEGVDWWRNEELSYSEMLGAVDLYELKKPRVMITHDCPEDIRKHFFCIYDKSITSSGLQVMFEIHQPDIWIFGHHHKRRDEKINGTRFICLEEFGTFVI